MKPKPKEWQLPLLIVGLVTVALVINYFFLQMRAARDAAEEQEQSAQQAAALAQENEARLAKERQEAALESARLAPT